MNLIDLMMAGRFAVYVVAAYAITAVVLTALTTEALVRAYHWKRRAQRAPKARRP